MRLIDAAFPAASRASKMTPPEALQANPLLQLDEFKLRLASSSEVFVVIRRSGANFGRQAACHTADRQPFLSRRAVTDSLGRTGICASLKDSSPASAMITSIEE